MLKNKQSLLKHFQRGRISISIECGPFAYDPSGILCEFHMKSELCTDGPHSYTPHEEVNLVQVLV